MLLTTFSNNKNPPFLLQILHIVFRPEVKIFSKSFTDHWCFLLNLETTNKFLKCLKLSSELRGSHITQKCPFGFSADFLCILLLRLYFTSYL